LEAFYHEQLGLIYRYVYRKVGNRQEDEDLTSSIFLKAVTNLQPEASPERMHHWLVRVVRTKIIDYWRAHARVTSSSLEALQEAGWEGPAEGDPFGVNDRPADRVQSLLLLRCAHPLSAHGPLQPLSLAQVWLLLMEQW
jgi:RNA polymerase sigma-70 factor, ECF subfamily